MAEMTEVTVLYDEAGNMIAVLTSAEKRIEKMLRKGKSIEGEPGVISIRLAGDNNG